MSNIKHRLLEACLAYVQHKIQTFQASLQAAQETSQSETKSSAGDKYETTRAMMQIDIENYTKSLAEAQNLQQTLTQIIFQPVYETVAVGSLVQTNYGTFFIAIGVGQLKLEDQTYFVVSASSPIGALLLKKKVGEQFTFNQKNYQVLEIL
jgi:hypothetical protein